MTPLILTLNSVLPDLLTQRELGLGIHFKPGYLSGIIQFCSMDVPATSYIMLLKRLEVRLLGSVGLMMRSSPLALIAALTNQQNEKIALNHSVIKIIEQHVSSCWLSLEVAIEQSLKASLRLYFLLESDQQARFRRLFSIHSLLQIETN